MDREEIREQELDEVVGGKIVQGKTYYTHVEDGYLALRNNTEYNYKNEIGALYNGSSVVPIADPVGDYVKVKVTNHVHGQWTAKDVKGTVGYVNKNCLR